MGDKQRDIKATMAEIGFNSVTQALNSLVCSFGENNINMLTIAAVLGVNEQSLTRLHLNDLPKIVHYFISNRENIYLLNGYAARVFPLTASILSSQSLHDAAVITLAAAKRGEVIASVDPRAVNPQQYNYGLTMLTNPEIARQIQSWTNKGGFPLTPIFVP
jgi:hypothetical protein